MKINPKLKEFLKEKGKEEKYEEIFNILSFSYFFPESTFPEYFPKDLLQFVFQSRLLLYDSLGGVHSLTLPLFEDLETESKMAWVDTFRNFFKTANSDRAGTRKTCFDRMKIFLRENPEIRAQEILGATEMYVSNTNPAYIMKSHKFIYDGAGSFRNSTLEEWVEKYREAREISLDKDISDKMQ